MSTKVTKTTAYHEVPTTVLSAFKEDNELINIWNNLTDIQRNEWACYATTGAKPETREKHIKRMQSDLKASKKTPCCWPGCPHRRPKASKWFGRK